LASTTLPIATPFKSLLNAYLLLYSYFFDYLCLKGLPLLKLPYFGVKIEELFLIVVFVEGSRIVFFLKSVV
jgi:hypothetical protein